MARINSALHAALLMPPFSDRIPSSDHPVHQAALDMKAVPQHLLPLLPLFCRSLTQMGTDKESFVELTERIGRKTGGLSVSTMISPVRGKKEPVAKLMVRMLVRVGHSNKHQR